MSLDMRETDTRADDSTPPADAEQAPYGYTKSGRVRTRPLGTSKRGKSHTPVTPERAHAAASVLARLNKIVGTGLFVAGFHRTVEELADANEAFETQAAEALLDDPELVSKILSAGASSAKVALLVAYGGLAIDIAPTLIQESREKRAERRTDQELSQQLANEPENPENQLRPVDDLSL